MKDTVSGVFAALADHRRREIYESLLESPLGRTATELAEAATISRQAIVKHLQVLLHSGLVDASRDGREVRYFVVTNGTRHASRWLDERSDSWDRRIAKLHERSRRVTKE